MELIIKIFVATIFVVGFYKVVGWLIDNVATELYDRYQKWKKDRR